MSSARSGSASGTDDRDGLGPVSDPHRVYRRERPIDEGHRDRNRAPDGLAAGHGNRRQAKVDHPGHGWDQQVRCRPGPDQLGRGRHHQPVVDDSGRSKSREIRLEFILDHARMNQLPEDRQVPGRQPEAMAARIPAGGGTGTTQCVVRKRRAGRLAGSTVHAGQRPSLRAGSHGAASLSSTATFTGSGAARRSIVRPRCKPGAPR